MLPTLGPPDPNLVLLFLLQAKGSWLLSPPSPLLGIYTICYHSLLGWQQGAWRPCGYKKITCGPYTHSKITWALLTTQLSCLWLSVIFFPFSSFPLSSLHTPFPFLPTVNKYWAVTSHKNKDVSCLQCWGQCSRGRNILKSLSVFTISGSGLTQLWRVLDHVCSVAVSSPKPLHWVGTQRKNNYWNNGGV